MTDLEYLQQSFDDFCMVYYKRKYPMKVINLVTYFKELLYNFLPNSEAVIDYDHKEIWYESSEGNNIYLFKLTNHELSEAAKVLIKNFIII